MAAKPKKKGPTIAASDGGGGSTPFAPARGLLAGAMLGAAAWLLLFQMGITNALRIGDYAGYVPAALGGALLGLFRRTAPLTAVNVAMALWLGVVAATPDAVAPFVRRRIREDVINPQAVEAVVVLSSGLNGDGFIDQQATDRLLSGLALVKRLNTPLLITSRVSSSADPAVSSDADQARLITLAATGARWEIVSPVYNTRDEANRVQVLGKKTGFTKIALVTSPMHTRRACAVFAQAGLTVTCVPAASRDVALRSLRAPSDRIVAARLALYEEIGTLYYQLRGWLPWETSR